MVSGVRLFEILWQAHCVQNFWAYILQCHDNEWTITCNIILCSLASISHKIVNPYFVVFHFIYANIFYCQRASEKCHDFSAAIWLIASFVFSWLIWPLKLSCDTEVSQFTMMPNLTIDRTYLLNEVWWWFGIWEFETESSHPSLAALFYGSLLSWLLAYESYQPWLIILTHGIAWEAISCEPSALNSHDVKSPSNFTY